MQDDKQLSQTTLTKTLDVNIGEAVVVKNNLPMPPKHHHKKRKAWDAWNFNGEVLDTDVRRNQVLIKNLDASNPVIEYRLWIGLDNPDRSILRRQVSVDHEINRE